MQRLVDSAAFVVQPILLQALMSFDTIELVKSHRTSLERNEQFLVILPTMGSKAYGTLTTSLKEGSKQQHLVELLENTAVSVEGINDFITVLTTLSYHSIKKTYRL